MRLDVYLVENGFFESRNKAANAVKDNNFTVNGKIITKPSYIIQHEDVVEMIKEKKIYVARSAHKLIHAFERFDLQWRGKVVADLGASTGGFCQVLLENNVKKVYAVDIGTAQLHPSVKNDPRIVNMEHCNARFLEKSSFPEPIEVITADLSFISIKAILPAIFNVLTNSGEAIVLIKPQFEAGPQNVGKNGVVKDRKIHFSVVEDVAGYAIQLGFFIKGISFSGLAGESGNREYLLYLSKESGVKNSIHSAIQAAVYLEG